jgi:uncharacterized membrane protein
VLTAIALAGRGRRSEERASLQAPARGARRARFWEIDALRGVAVVSMVFFHLMWDLSYLGMAGIDIYATPWRLFARGIGTTFTLLLGLSLTLSYARRQAGPAPPTGFAAFLAYLRRGAGILALGMVVSLVTHVVIGPFAVVFGILHLLGLSVILAYPFLQASPWVSLLAGLAGIAAGSYLNSVVAPYPWLTWLGVPGAGLAMVDYYPLLPWFGVALLGVAAGKVLYPRGARRFALAELGQAAPVRGLCFLGRNSLVIYMVHQPILLGSLLAITWALLRA